MPLHLSIEEQERLTKGHKALLNAVDRYVKAENDLKLYKYSENYKRAYKAAYTNLKEVAANEKKHINGQQKSIF